MGYLETYKQWTTDKRLNAEARAELENIKDDKDDIDTGGSPAVRVHNNRKYRHDDFDDEDNIDNNTDDNDDIHKSGSSLIGGIKRRLAKFWSDPQDDEDDLDAPAE